uniref:Uncharacterized protein n=1 Tax=Cannabis sativa TaxID=3483 RepID=A0A803NNE7_CANSA
MVAVNVSDDEGDKYYEGNEWTSHLLLGEGKYDSSGLDYNPKSGDEKIPTPVFDPPRGSLPRRVLFRGSFKGMKLDSTQASFYPLPQSSSSNPPQETSSLRSHRSCTLPRIQTPRTQPTIPMAFLGDEEM